MPSESMITKILNHPNRSMYVYGLAVFVLLLAGLPAYDALASQSDRITELEIEIEDLGQELANEDFIGTRLAEVKQLAETENLSIDRETAMSLREELAKLTQEHQCRLIHIQLGDPREHHWSPDTNPMIESATGTAKETNLKVQKTKLSIAVVGLLSQVDQLLGKISNLHPLAVPTRLQVVRNTADESVKVEVSLTLISLLQSST
ncbi:MAG: hypothetical protein ACE361_00825 [Aureliella sp.]